MLCLMCDQDISKNHFPQHLRRYHTISKDQYKDQFNLHVFCSCGCGTKIKDHLKWVHGHHSRVNNISKRADIRKKRSQFLKEQHAKGLRPEIWNKGLTKESDERVAQYGSSNSENFTIERKEQMSKSMKRAWATGAIVPNYGSTHPAWKGGTSPLHTRIRSNHTLYKEWKLPILKRDNFKCLQCSSTKELQVHHHEVSMSDIMQEFVSKDDQERTFDEDTILIGRIVQYHIDKSIPGETICKECHQKEHPSYNL